MEITKKGITTTKILGSAPARGTLGVLEDYIETNVDKRLLSFFQQDVKKGEEIEQTIERILSVFHRDENGSPVIGAWMLKKCLVNTGVFIFNAQKNKAHPKRDLIQNVAIGEVTPLMINMKNGRLVKKQTGIDTHAVTIRDPKSGKPRSFFKAYEYIDTGVEFEVTMQFDEVLFNGRENIDFLLSRCGNTGIGAFRQRFGKFKWLN